MIAWCVLSFLEIVIVDFKISFFQPFNMRNIDFNQNRAIIGGIQTFYQTEIVNMAIIHKLIAISFVIISKNITDQRVVSWKKRHYQFRVFYRIMVQRTHKNWLF